ncbi:UNVERIFIED_CONTAM: hypothetical protein GTU68_055479 [Idotea baltica]|nr:hypothetical protein [Idotea baltica]
MRLNEVTYSDARPVDGYGPGFFRIAGKVYEGDLLILPGGVSAWSGYDDPGAVVKVADQIDVLFVGTGAEIVPIPAAFRSVLEDAGLGVEIMNTPSACRTYNVLLSEGRRIGLALIAV